MPGGKFLAKFDVALSVMISYSVITSLFYCTFDYPIIIYSHLWYMEIVVFITFLVEMITNFLKLPDAGGNIDEATFK